MDKWQSLTEATISEKLKKQVLHNVEFEFDCNESDIKGNKLNPTLNRMEQHNGTCLFLALFVFASFTGLILLEFDMLVSLVPRSGMHVTRGFTFHTCSWKYDGQSIVSFEPPHDKTNKMACAPSKDSDQPGHLPSLIRVFTVHLKKVWVLSYPLSAQQRLWSDWADAQADVSSLGAQSFCWFCHEAAHYVYPCKLVESRVYLGSSNWEKAIVVGKKPSVLHICSLNFGS